jgi:hypothetical protein
MGDKQPEVAANEDRRMSASREVFLYFLILGFINVGGSVAQITMMYNRMVERRGWLSAVGAMIGGILYAAARALA